MALSTITKDTSDLHTYFSIEEFCKLANRPRKTMLRRIQYKDKELEKCAISICNKSDVETIFWIDYIAYTSDDKICIKFNDSLKKYLLFNDIEACIGRGYTKLPLKIMFKFKKFYSLRLYELFKQYRFIGKRKLFFHDLKPMLGYNKSSNEFNRNIIIPAINEINTYSDILVEPEPIKHNVTGKYLGMNFIFKTNTNNFIK